MVQLSVVLTPSLVEPGVVKVPWFVLKSVLTGVKAGTMQSSRNRWLWRRFHYVWDVAEPGQYKVMARGTDEKGRVQPTMDWNFQRKHFDGIVPEIITVEKG
jgi:hypothetical protein